MYASKLSSLRFLAILFVILGTPLKTWADDKNSVASVFGSTGSAFITACQTTAGDPYFPQGTVLALVHSLDRVKYIATVLLAINDKGDPRGWPRAWMHWGEEQFIEAEGGVASTKIASDVIKSLRNRPFSLVEDWQSALLGEHDFAHCEIKYTEEKKGPE